MSAEFAAELIPAAWGSGYCKICNYEFWRDTFNFHFGHSPGKKVGFEKF